jgi:hypothetical protein
VSGSGSTCWYVLTSTDCCRLPATGMIFEPGTGSLHWHGSSRFKAMVSIRRPAINFGRGIIVREALVGEHVYRYGYVPVPVKG